MALRVQTNVDAFRAHRYLSDVSDLIGRSQEKLTSGYRINRAADDAAGLAISLKLRAQVGGIQQAQRNAQDAVSLVQTAEGALTEVSNMLQRVRDLGVQYNNGTLSASDKAAITAEVAQLQSEIQRISNDTKFNGISLLTGTTTVTFQIGADAGQTLTFGLSTVYGTTISAAIFSFGATADLSSIDASITSLAQTRANFGGIQNRMEYLLRNLAIYEENLSASLSRVLDTDIAQETVNLTKLQIVQQAGLSMLAQANLGPQSVLSLLQSQ